MKTMPEMMGDYLGEDHLMTTEEKKELTELEKEEGIEEAAACWNAWRTDRYLLGKNHRKEGS